MLGALAVAVPAHTATKPPAPFGPDRTEQQAVRAFLAKKKVADWVGRYPKRNLATQGTYEKVYRVWTVHVWSGPAGEIARGRVDDLTGIVTEAWTGPQVAWTMARGGRRRIRRQADQPPRGLARRSALVFLLGLADLRRPLLAAEPRPARAALVLGLALVLQRRATSSRACRSSTRRSSTCSRAASGSARADGRDVARPRLAGVGAGRGDGLPRRLPDRARTSRDSNVIDVGYSGVIGARADRRGESAVRPLPGRGRPKPCGPADPTARSATGSRRTAAARSANPHGDTYGPVAYEAYLPGYWRSAGRGSGTPARRALHVDPLRPALRCSGSRSSGGASAGRGWRRRSRSPGSRTRSRSTSRARTRTTRSSPRC